MCQDETFRVSNATRTLLESSEFTDGGHSCHLRRTCCCQDVLLFGKLEVLKFYQEKLQTVGKMRPTDRALDGPQTPHTCRSSVDNA